ncbi:uncharacterized protein LOC131528938 [Onychostoma macrolepis]|uniref:Uncharacterized protein n=1 Tax=Onychostoma macrolepis TaxID=369639 RepID=A0A7J6BTR4_9TELE|nr:uncharacterized protein LOC131528938 [Onychostoma macrolepis]KAF4098131.1 hypothetical protein G5714_020161 [Onychostoma macrolepis]
MAAAAKKDTVWIGFMDIVPVIGAVREAVELVLALYEGNKAVIKEKEKAVENLVKESLIKDVKKLTLSDKPAAAEVDKFSGLRNVREVRKERIIEYMVKGGKKGTKPPTPAEQKERQKRVEKIKEGVLEKIRILKPDFNQELKFELGRSKRGEHVFNNNILRFHSKVLTKFREDNNNVLQGCNQQAMNDLGRHTLTLETAKEIQTEMVVDFGEDEFYMNANAVVYGVYCSALREAMLAVLRRINPDDVTPEKKQRVNFIIDNMNNLEIYVDELAKVKWIANNATIWTRFDDVRREVVKMYKTDRGVDWCIDILHSVAPLFNTSGSQTVGRDR